MPKPTVAEIIAAAQSSGEYRSIKEFVGQVLNFVSFETKAGKDGDYLIIDALTAENDEVQIRTGAAQVVEILRGLAVNDMLPYELRVDSFKTANGTGFTLEEVDE